MYISFEVQNFNNFRKKYPKKILSKSKSECRNTKIKYMYEYILYIYYFSLDNGDFWYLGGGNNDIQLLINEFNAEDWNELKKDLINWESFHRDILIDAIPFGFDKMFSPSLNKDQIPFAGNFLLDLFDSYEEIELRSEISYFSFFINMSNSNQILKLENMKKWMLENGYDNDDWNKSPINPIGNINEAIKKASS